MASDNPPMGANLDLQNGRIFRTTDGLKGSFTLGTATVVAGKFRIFDVGGQMAVIAPAMPLLTALLTTRPLGGACCGWRPGELWLGGRCRFRLAAEELLFPQT